MKKKIVFSLFLMFVSLITIITTIFAWVTLSNESRISSFIASVEDYRITFSLKVKKNNEDYQTIVTQEEWLLTLNDALPNDTFSFILSVKNDGNTIVPVFIYITSISSETVIPELDMRNVFYLVDGKLTVDDEENDVTPNNSGDVIDHGQLLDLYRLSNITDTSGGLMLLNGKELIPGDTSEVKFTIKYDEETSNTGYHGGSIKFNSIKIYS